MPQNWKTYKLDDLLTVLTDYHANGAYKKLKAKVTILNKEDYAIMIRTTNFEKSNFNDFIYVNQDAYEFLSKSKVYSGDILMNKIANAGSVYQMPKLNKPVTLAMNLFLLRFNDEVNQDYLYHHLKGNEQYIKTFAAGSVTKTITKDAVRNLEFNLPPLPEQTAIASILSTIDAKIENNLAINKTLEEMAMALYKEWFVDFGPFQEGEFVESELEMIPEGWEVKRLEEVLEIKYGKDHKKLEDGSIPVYGSGGIMRYVDTFLYDEDSILIPRKGTLSNLFYVTEPFWSVDTMFYSKIKKKEMGQFLFHFIERLDLAGMDVGSAVPSLTTALLKRLDVLIPPIEQIKKFDEVATKYFENRMSNIKQNQTLTTFRDTLLPKLISGEVRLDCFVPRSDASLRGTKQSHV